MDIILLTIGYPYPNKDIFVRNEIRILSEKFDNVWIVPVLEGIILPKLNYKSEIEELPENVRVEKIKYNFVDILKIKKTILSNLIYNIKLDKKSILKLLRDTFHASIVHKNLITIISKNNIDLEKTILYSYWFHYNALAISLIQDTKLKVSRAHGYDLYEERCHQPYKKIILEKIDKVYACSSMGQKYICQKYETNNVEISYLGTYNNLKEINIPVREKYFKIVSCSRLTHIKQVHKIIDALFFIENKNIEWIHIGDGPLYEELKNYASSRLGEKKNIKYEFLGYLSNEDVLNFYESNNINLFLNVSLSEGLPVSIMEAISFSIPIIATDVGGTNEVVENNKNGYLLKSEFIVKDLVSKINKIISIDENEYKCLCENSRKIWRIKFNAETNYDKFFENLIDEAKLNI